MQLAKPIGKTAGNMQSVLNHLELATSILVTEDGFLWCRVFQDHSKMILKNSWLRYDRS